MALKKGRELGGKAIDAAAKRVESEASKRGIDVSKFTEAAASKAHEHLHEAEGHVAKQLDAGQAALERKAGVGGSGHGEYGRQKLHGSGHGRKHFRGGDMYEAGSGGGMYRAETSGGSLGTSFIHAPTSYGIPDGAMLVSSTSHLQ
jgi:hypothetical protein